MMTHRPYTPPAWQSKPLADGRVTLLVVPLRPQPKYEYRSWETNLPYAPGDLIWCRETWSGEYAFRDVIPSQRESVFTPDGLFLRDNIWYWADGSPEFGDFERPRSPVTMPKWASRTWLRCTGVEVRRVQTISEDEAIANGILENRLNCYGPDCPIDQLRSCNTHGCWGIREDFSQRFPNFAANPWAAFVAVKKISKEKEND